MRSYSFRSEHLAESGSNLSGVLHNLCREQDKKDELLAFVRALPEQDITKIDFIETPRGEVMVTLTETFGGSSKPYEAPLLSDGTLRVLAIAAGILSSPGPVVVIEEIDNGVHPGAPVSSSTGCPASRRSGICACSSAATIRPCWTPFLMTPFPTWSSATGTPKTDRAG